MLLPSSRWWWKQHGKKVSLLPIILFIWTSGFLMKAGYFLTSSVIISFSNNILHHYKYYTMFKVYIYFPSMPRSAKWTHFYSDFLHVFHICPKSCLTFLRFHPPSFHHPNNILCGVLVTKVHIKTFLYYLQTIQFPYGMWEVHGEDYDSKT
jgi:hypothetical protein